MGMIVKVKVKVAQIHQTSIKLQILRGRLLFKSRKNKTKKEGQGGA